MKTHQQHPAPSSPARRAMLRTGGLALATGAAGAIIPGFFHAAAPVQPAPETPAAALAALIAGNRRVVAGRPIAPHRDLGRLREIAPKQAPFAAFLGCADSRVPVEIVFDQGFGDVFVSRIAGNIAVVELGA